MSRMGLDFDAIPSEFEEYFDEERSVIEVVEELGLGKAMDVAKKNPDAIVVGSDTIIVLDNKQLGKPENAGVAKAMLRAYRNRSHQIITSVAVVCINKNYKRIASDVSSVTMDELDEEFIEKYVATGTMYDKGGSYAIQHPMVRPHIRSISGRIDTIVGLPTHIVAEFLKDFDIESNTVDLSNDDLLNDKGLYE